MPIYLKIGPNWPNWLVAPKQLPGFRFFLIAMGAEYLSYVKSIATNTPTFFGYIISVLANVKLYDKQYAVAVAHRIFTPVSDLCHLRISFWL